MIEKPIHLEPAMPIAGEKSTRREILDGKVAVPKSARRLVADLTRYEPHTLESSRD
jgi:hypothetical protein